MKQIIYLIMFLFVIGVVSASVCTDNVNANVSCLMVTPSLSCPVYNFSVYNETKDLVQSGNLSLQYSNIYAFNFSQNVGVYLILLCDGSTRQITVGGGDTMFLIAIVLLPLIVGFGLLYWAFQLSEEHATLKGFFQLLFIPLTLLSILLGIDSVGYFYPQATDLVSQLGNFTEYISYLLYVVGAYILIWLGIKVFKLIQEQIAVKREGKFND